MNRSEADCVLVAVSAGDADGGGVYSYIDMTFGADGYQRRDGTPYPVRRL